MLCSVQVYSGPLDSLPRPVRFLATMHTIPRVAEKVQLVTSLRGVQLDLTTTIRNVDDLATACNQARPRACTFAFGFTARR